MALGSRELLLVIRARDEASRAMHSLGRSMRNVDRDTRKAAAAQIERGRALSSIGVGVMAVGAAGAAAIADWTKAAMDYEQQAAKTLTQVDKHKISLEEIKKVGLEVAKAIPAPLEQMQETLFYIFSSMDTDLEGSRKLLENFAKAGVAGQVDLQDAARGTIGILNAYNMTAKDSTRVNDVMFKLVHKGVGTYGEFSKVIGRVVPSAVRAGQSIESVAGMMAFLTRNGLSAAMASTSAARALDAISHPKTVAKFHNLDKAINEALGDKRTKQLKATTDNFDKLGVRVVTASGKFRPMNEVMTDLGRTFQRLKLSGPEIAAVLQEIFKGSGGTIQARRFFDVAVKNFEQLNTLTGDMKDSAGALDNAYNIMFKQPQTQIQLLKNNYQALKIELGQALIPVVLKLVQWFIKLFQWFNNLSPTTKKWIAYIMIAVSALLLIAGAIITVVGFFLIFAGAAAAAGISLGTVGAVIGIIIGVIAALAAAVFLVIKYWDPIKNFFVSLWNTVSAFFVSAWNKIVSIVTVAATRLWKAIKTAWNVIVTIFKLHIAVILAIIVLWWRTLAKPMRWFFNLAWSVIKSGWDVITKIFKAAFNIISTATKAGWAFIEKIFKIFWNWVKPFVNAGINFIKREWDRFWGMLRKAASTGWNLIKGEFDRFWSAMKRGFTAGKNAIIGIWNSIKKPLAGPVNFVIDVVWNRGIAKAWNTAVDIVNLPSKYRAPHLSPVRWATGGYISGPGGPTDDKIPAWLSNGEFVVRASQTKKWLPVLQAINNGMQPRGGIPGFQLGGLVSKIKGATGFLMDVISDPVGAMKKALNHAMGSLSKLSGSRWGQILSAVPKRMIDLLVEGFKAIWKKFGVSGNAGKAIAFARAQIGKWYEWGATGPNTYDCSGLTMRAWQAAGKNITRTTYTQRRAMKRIPRPIPGAVGQPHEGHTYLASGINPTRVIEAARTGTRISEHVLRRPTPWWGWPRAMGGFINAAEMRRKGRLGQRLLGVNFLGSAMKMRQARWMGLAGDPGGVVPGFGPTRLADNGAYVRPGLNAIMNHTGARERILDPQETAAYERGEGHGRPIIIYTHEIDPRRHAAELGWELDRRVT